jgi:hypothetical protein
VKPYSIFDIGENRGYFGDRSASNLNNGRIMRKVAESATFPRTPRSRAARTPS